MTLRVGVDAREWVVGRRTGIGRFLEEVLYRAMEVRPDWQWTLYFGHSHEERLSFPGLAYRHLPTGPTPWIDQVVLPRALRRDHPDLFFSPYIKIPWKAPCPCVATVHDLLLLSLPASRGGLRGLSRVWFALYSRRSVRRAAAVVTVSESSKSEIQKWLGIPGESVHVIPEAAGRVFRDGGGLPGPEVRQRHGLSDPYLLVVSNYRPHKNITMLLRAWASVCATRSVGVLALAGEGPDVPTLKEEAARLGIGTRLRWLGRVEDEELPGLYREAVALLQPSFSEGFGLPVVEAMVSGTPVVVSDRGSLPEVVDEGSVVLSPEDEDGWAAVMERLLMDRQERKHWSDRARRRGEVFRPETTTDRLLDLLERIGTGNL